MRLGLSICLTSGNMFDLMYKLLSFGLLLQKAIASKIYPLVFLKNNNPPQHKDLMFNVQWFYRLVCDRFLWLTI